MSNQRFVVDRWPADKTLPALQGTSPPSPTTRAVPTLPLLVGMTTIPMYPWHHRQPEEKTWHPKHHQYGGRLWQSNLEPREPKSK